jgi:2-polyprenyl-3-methyl-5-hydroxy-6-metoxy-1,4-benzoquinol methylase
MAGSDKSNGYEEVAADYLAGRGRAVGGIGAATVAKWARTLPPAATVLDLGCGTGVPISQVLIERGFLVHGVDASPTLVAAFRDRFPNNPVECAAVEDSDFFGKKFDAVVSVGLFFLLDEQAQLQLIEKIAGALRSGGQLLFTAPRRICSWTDGMTDRTSFGLGFDVYRDAVEAHGLSLVGTQLDEGENHYYVARKT